MALEPGSLDDTFLTVAEVAELLKLNQQTVRNWIDQGSLRALKVGRRVRIRRSELERLLEESSITVTPEEVGGPSADDFWSGEVVAVGDPGPSDPRDDRAPRDDSDPRDDREPGADSEPADNRPTQGAE